MPVFLLVLLLVAMTVLVLLFVPVAVAMMLLVAVAVTVLVLLFVPVAVAMLPSALALVVPGDGTSARQ